MAVWKTFVSSQNGSSSQVGASFIWKPPPCRICLLSLIFIYHLYLLHNWAYGLTIVWSSKLSFLEKPLAVQSWPAFQSRRMPHKEAWNLSRHRLTTVTVTMLNTATTTQSGNIKQYKHNQNSTRSINLILSLASRLHDVNGTTRWLTCVGWIAQGIDS